MKKTPQINKINEFLEIASDFEDPLEVLRESLSNSHDARASTVSIRIENSPHGSDIVIEDDGKGMGGEDLAAFFDLGNSTKEDGIGYKGHGTKIFYKSNHITVETVNDGVRRRAEMDQPWQKLNRREMPEYEVTRGKDATSLAEGSRISIRGFKSGQDFQPTSLSYNKIENYIAWKTIGGSTRHFFDDDAHEMEITVELGDDIDNTRESVTMSSHFEFPDEQLRPSDSLFPAERMCKVYPEQELQVSYEGGSTTIQIVGMAGDKAARNELPTFGKHSTQFGVWLAKDHIKVEQVNDVISSDNEFIHFLFVANCQDLELSANRETIRNKSSEVYRAVVEKLDHFMSKVTADPWFQKYLEYRKEGEINRQAKSQTEALDERVQKVREREQFTPSNPMEVAVALERSNSHVETTDVTVEDFAPREDVNAILKRGSEFQNAIIETSLEEVLDGETPITNVDTVVCHELGDPDELREIELAEYLGGNISIDYETPRLTYDDGTRHNINIILMKDRLPGG